MNPALKNAPAPCREDDAWRNSLDVRYPYMGVDNAVVRVAPTFPALGLLAQAFDLPEGAGVPNGTIGWDSIPERSYRLRLQEIGQEAKFFAKGPVKTRRQVNELGKAALATLNVTIPKLYNEDPRLSMGGPLSQSMPNGTPAQIIARDNLRRDIIDAYEYAAQLLWCAEYGMAQVEAYLANREEYEAPIKPTPGGLIDPAWTQYEPVEFEESDWDIGSIDPFAPQEQEQEEEESTGGGAGAIAVIAALGIGALLIFRR